MLAEFVKAGRRLFFVVPYLGKKQIQKVQTYDLEQFYATLSRTPRGLYKQGVKQTLTDKQKRQFLTGASIREVHAMLKTAFSYAVEWGLLLKGKLPRPPRRNVPFGMKRLCLRRCRP